VRSILATGCSARQARDNILLTSHYLLPTLEAEHLCDEVPDLPWFSRQREALGLEASVYAFIALGNPQLFPSPKPLRSHSFTILCLTHLGRCDEVVQWGFDETTLDGQACFNQWCLLRTGTSL
jgi:hypothetical protein